MNGCLNDLDVRLRDIHINFVVDCARTGQIASRKCRLRNSVRLSQDFTTAVYVAREKSLFHLHGKRVLGIWRKWVTMNTIYPTHNFSSLSNFYPLKPRDLFFTLLGRKKTYNVSVTLHCSRNSEDAEIFVSWNKTKNTCSNTRVDGNVVVKLLFSSVISNSD